MSKHRTRHHDRAVTEMAMENLNDAVCDNFRKGSGMAEAVAGSVLAAVIALVLGLCLGYF